MYITIDELVIINYKQYKKGGSPVRLADRGSTRLFSTKLVKAGFAAICRSLVALNIIIQRHYINDT
jgi:hypothetical protein